MISIRRVVAHLSLSVVSLGTLIVASPSAHAQLTAANARWQAWVGCWRPEDPSQSPFIARPVVCVVPTPTASAVDVVTVDSGKLVSRYTVDASGAQRSVNRDGCTGWERARWSDDSLRVFLSSELTCGAVRRSAAGIMSITQGGDWLTIDAVKAGANEAVRATRYRDVDAPAQLPPEIAAAATLGRRLDRRTAAIAAGAKLTSSIIVEAIQAADTAAVQAWLVERHEMYNLDSKTLIALADAGVPGSVTDIMIAASYPDEFHFSRGPAPGAMMAQPSALDSARIAADYLLSRDCDPLSYYSPYGWGVNPCNSYSSSYRYGYPGNRLGYGYGYGYGGYGYGYGNPVYYGGAYGGAYGGPVVIVQNNGNDAARGRAVKGQGYTRGGSSSSGGSSASTSSAPSSGGSSSGSSSSGASSSSGSSSSGGSSSSSGRTAIPKPPSL